MQFILDYYFLYLHRIFDKNVFNIIHYINVITLFEILFLLKKIIYITPFCTHTKVRYPFKLTACCKLLNSPSVDGKKFYSRTRLEQSEREKIFFL